MTSRSRTTIDLRDLRDRINTMLRVSTCEPEGRVALSTLLESVLTEAGQYRGFSYVGAENARWLNTPLDERPDEMPDETRRRYH